MKLIFIGGPGAGKGTQAQKIVDVLKIPQISAGDLLRTEVTAGTPLGRRAAEFLMVGKLVPDVIIIRIIHKRLREEDCDDGFILDGFPRTISQAMKLKEIVDIDWVVLIEVPPKILLERYADRRSCSKCNSVFHLVYNPPKQEKVCDHCGGKLYRRADDNPETINLRIKLFRKETKPVIEFYEEEKKLKRINGDGSIQDVFEDIIKALGYVKYREHFPLDHHLEYSEEDRKNYG
jgi:adenylate kinase